MIALGLMLAGNIAGSFFCSLSEAALLSSSEARIRARMERGAPNAALLLDMKQNPGRTLASIVFLNNVFGIAGTATISAYATTVLPPAAMAVFIGVQTLLIIAFGEIVPKVLGEARAERIAMAVAPTLVVVRFVLAPMVYLVQHLVGWARPSARALPGEEEEIRELARLGHEGGHIDADEAELIRRVFRLDDLSAEDVMTPRRLVRGVPEDASLDSLRDVLLDVGHAQVPVYRGDLDMVTGVMSIREALAALVRGEGTKTPADVMKKALFLPGTRRVDDVLADVQGHHGTMAIVIDEYGSTEGVITMDDLVEELVGEAIDDREITAGLVKRLSRDVAHVHGLTRIGDVARLLRADVPWTHEDEETSTVTGLLQERLGRIPVVGDEITVAGRLHLSVKQADPRMAVRVHVRHLRPAGDVPRPADATA